jgi:hypothetical protein
MRMRSSGVLPSRVNTLRFAKHLISIVTILTESPYTAWCSADHRPPGCTSTRHVPPSRCNCLCTSSQSNCLASRCDTQCVYMPYPMAGNVWETQCAYNFEFPSNFEFPTTDRLIDKGVLHLQGWRRATRALARASLGRVCAMVIDHGTQ